MLDSLDVTRASIQLAISSRKEEKSLQASYLGIGIKTAAVDIGGNINNSTTKVLESALVAAKRSGLIEDCHVHDGAVVGATREAIMQVAEKAHGLNVGGKIGIARSGEHISVCIFMSIGLLHLNEVVIGLSHRSIPDSK